LKPSLLESVIVSTPPITRTHILELPSAIDESCVIKLNSDYPIDSIEHHLKDAFESNKNIDCTIDTSLTSIEALTPNLGTIDKEVSISLNKRYIERRLKRMMKRKLLNRSKRPPTECWRLNDEKFDQVNKTYRLTLEGCCDPLGFNGHMKLPFYSKNISLLDHDVSKQSIYYNHPWSLAIKCRVRCFTCRPLESLFAIRSRSVRKHDSLGQSVTIF